MLFVVAIAASVGVVVVALLISGGVLIDAVVCVVVLVVDGIVAFRRCCLFDVCGDMLFDCVSLVAVVVVVAAAVALFLLYCGVVVLVSLRMVKRVVWGAL